MAKAIKEKDETKRVKNLFDVLEIDDVKRAKVLDRVTKINGYVAERVNPQGQTEVNPISKEAFMMLKFKQWLKECCDAQEVNEEVEAVRQAKIAEIQAREDF